MSKTTLRITAYIALAAGIIAFIAGYAYHLPSLIAGGVALIVLATALLAVRRARH